jgi:hypothetical protein
MEEMTSTMKPLFAQKTAHSQPNHVVVANRDAVG